MKKNEGITLISLIITIVILIILASIAITLSLGKKGIFTRAKEAKELTNRQSATEELNIKITAIKIDKYAEKQQMPTLKELAEELKKDEDIKYITEISKIAEVEYNVPSENPTVIYTRLEKYPYEFEINSELEIKRIDGKEIEQTGSSNIQTSVGDFEITTPYIGTTSLTVKINKETINEEIKKYIYIIGEKVIEQAQEELIIEELSEDTPIYITVIAITDQNKQLVARKIIKTEPRTYLYNNGDECTQLTGGWKAEEIGCGNSAIVIKPEINTNKDGTLYAYIEPTTTSYYGGSIIINNKIDYSKYKKICFRMSAKVGNYKAATVIDLYANHNDIKIISRICGGGNGALNNQIVKYNIDNINNIEDIYIYLQGQGGVGGAYCTINEVWLEK